MTNKPSSCGPVNGVVGLACVFCKLFILPIMMAAELVLLLSVLLIGILNPRLGLRLNEWFSTHLPNRVWYWERPMSEPNHQDNRAAQKPSNEKETV